MKESIMSTTLDLLRVVNTSKDKPLILRHDGKGDVTIEPGRHRILLAEYAYLSFGDPRAFNAGKDKARDVEFKNARTLWGFYPGVYPEAAWDDVGIEPATGEEIGPFKPSFECYDMDDNRVLLVLDDPDGTTAASLSGVPSSTMSDNVERDAMAAQMAALQQQVLDLQTLVLQTGLQAPGPVADIPEDEEDGDDDEDEDDEEEPEEPVKKGSTPAARKAVAAKKAAGKTQAARNEARDNIPTAPKDEPVVTADNPKARRVGGR